MANEFTLDARQVRSAGRLFRGAEAEIRNELRRELRSIGREVADAAEAASSHISHGVLRVGTRGTVGVTVRMTASEPEPHKGKALAFENGGRAGTFRHPVFGHRDRWVSQDADPALTRVAEANYARMVAKVGAAVERALNRL